MRVYVPASTATLRRLAIARRLDPPIAARAVTAAVQARHPDDLDLQEDDVLAEAALDCLRLLADNRSAARRVVIVAEVPAALVTLVADGAGGAVSGSSVLVQGAVPLAWVWALMADDAVADPAVAAAVAALRAGDDPVSAAGSAAALADRPLSWFATQELDDMIV